MLEVAGETVLNSLLNKFSSALSSSDLKNPKSGDAKLYSIISENFRFIYEQSGPGSEIYTKLQLMIDFISGMTGSYALNLHRTLIGVTLP